MTKLKIGGKTVRSSPCLLACVLVLCCSGLAIYAAEYDVNWGGTGDFTSIQAAIDAAVDGDVIVVHPGTYYENIHFDGKNITLSSLDPQDEGIVALTIIDGDRDGSVVTFAGTEDETCLLSGFIIIGGSSVFGGGIDGRCALAQIGNCRITGNSAEYGGGLYSCHGPISNCTITGNSTQFYGGGLCWCYGRINNCTITGNSTQYYGGGLAGCGGTISNCTITGNSGDYGGGLFRCCGTINNCTITGNSAKLHGGGLNECNGAITNCTISGNYSGNCGGGLYECDGEIGNCMITRNCASDSGGGLYYCDGTISNGTISGNTASWGGGLCWCNCTISNCTISGNSAKLHGGALYDCDGPITNCTISGNSAGLHGGGLSWCAGTISDCTISGNSAWADGGGLYYCNGAICNCIVWANDAAEGPELFQCEAAIAYCCIRGWTGGATGNISADPLFLSGALGDYYLSCRAAGQDADSPCIGAGSASAESLGLNKFTTRTDGVPDAGVVDMGYHYPLTAEENPTIECSLNNNEFSPGDSLVAQYDIGNPGPDITVDVYFAFVMPDGAILCISPTRIDFGIFPCTTDVFLHQGYSMEPTSLLSIGVPGGLPVGNYLFAGALSMPGQFQIIGEASLFEFALSD